MKKKNLKVKNKVTIKNKIIRNNKKILNKFMDPRCNSSNYHLKMNSYEII